MPTSFAPTPSSATPARQRSELILHEIDALPTLPAIAARLIAVTSSDDSSAHDIVELIGRDPALTATLLRSAGGADKGIHNSHLTLHQAVTLLGFNTVRNAVLSVQIHAALPQPEENERAMLFRRELWRHALATACAAEELAPMVLGAGDQGDAFVAGLLHDLGKFALDAGFPKSYARVVERVERKRQNVCDAECEVFGFDHTVAGRRLATRWNLPPAVVECTWLHHQDPTTLPRSVRHGRLVALIHLADRLVRRLRIGFSGYREDTDLELTAERLEVTPEKLHAVALLLPERLAPLGEWLGLDDEDARHLYAESLQKANRELGTLNGELADANRRLAKRSLFFDVLHSFTRGLTPENDVAAVCRQAAAALAQAGQTKIALVMLVDPWGEFAHLAAATSASVKSTVLAVESEWVAAIHDLPAGPSRLNANSPLSALWREKTSGVAHADGVTAIPLNKDQELLGAILLPLHGERDASDAAEWSALTQAISLAATRALSQRNAERHQEELYDLSRRLQCTQRELVRSRTISMIAEMAAGAAHEINNPLSVISGRAQLLLGGCHEAEPRRALQIIIDQANEASQIVTELMNFAKPAPPQPILQPLPPLLEALCQHWRDRFSLSPSQLSLRIADAECSVFADTQHLSDMLAAVVANAAQAGEGETRRVEINSPSSASDETVRIEVWDNGPGMSPEVAEHAIDPFFSHRPAGRGRGLGLSRAYRLAGVNGGNLWVDSTPQVGTTVTIELPSRPKAMPPTTPPAGAAPSASITPLG